MLPHGVAAGLAGPGYAAGPAARANILLPFPWTIALISCNVLQKRILCGFAGR